jgi:hypothetical protein
MRTLRPILLALTAVAALSVAYPAKANLITNGGFETGDFTGWTVSGPQAFVGGSANGISPHSGNFQAVFSFAGPADLSQSVATTPGQSYMIDFFAATNSFGPFSATMAVNWGGSTVFSHLFTSATGYTEFTFTETASASSTLLDFALTGTFGDFVFDDISVNAVGAVPDGGTTVSLLGCALLGLAALRRRLGC